LFDLARVALQLLDFLFESNSFLVEPLDIGVHLLDFLSRAPHREVSVGPENVVDHQREQQQAQERAAILTQKGDKLFLRLSFFQSCNTHFVASFVNFVEAAALSASTYSRKSGSVPDRRNSIQEPSSKTNFAPSVRSMDTTFRPNSVELSTPTLRTAFAFCSSLKCRFSRTGQNSRPSFLYNARICSPIEEIGRASCREWEYVADITCTVLE